MPGMKIKLIARDPKTGEAIVIEADGRDDVTAVEAARAQIPPGWEAVSVREV